MPPTCPRQLIDEVLAAVERQELTSLQWGYVDGSLSYEQLDAIVSPLLPAYGAVDIDPADVVEDMIELALLFEFVDRDGTPRYRSRFAEGVRLLSSLKQLFWDGPPWSVAPSLVNDFRVDFRP